MFERDQPRIPEDIKYKNIEDDIFTNINKKILGKLIEENKIDFDKVILRKKSYNEHYHKFNYLIKKLVYETNITMIDCATFLLTDYFKERLVFDCFDEENMHQLRMELANKYRIKTDGNILKYFVNKNY